MVGPNTNSQRHRIAIGSWNIESITEGKTKVSKTSFSGFNEIILKHDIMCLQETIKSFDIKGYRSYSNLRKSTSGKTINHGGVVTLVSKKISHGVERMSHLTKSTEILIIKLKKHFFHTRKDICIVNCYVSPKTSKYYRLVDYDPYDELNNVLQKLLKDDKFSVILCGDFNARFGDSLDYIPSVSTTSENLLFGPQSSLDFIGERNHRDKNSNGYKDDFLDLVIGNELCIANGRILGDIFGNPTCIKYNGYSTVDYAITSADLFNNCNSFQVLPFTEHSDHCPISLSLDLHFDTCTAEEANKIYKIPARYKITAESIDIYKEIQKSGPNIEKMSLLMEHDITNIDDFNISVVTFINETAVQALDRTKPSLKKKPTKCNDWYDESCRSFKKALGRSLDVVNKFPDCTLIREKHYMNKKAYFRYLRSKKRTHMSELNQRIENGKVLDWKAFDKLKNSNNSRIEFDSSDINAFHKFFTNLYGDEQDALDQNTKDNWMHAAEILQGSLPTTPSITVCTEELNKEIELSELKHKLSQLSNGKSSSDDMICNELLKSLSEPYIHLLLKLFNGCLEQGKYPWHNAIVTPLHKKGDKYNPDNYRAIAVGSCVGKLFSSILLERLTRFKRSVSPDPVNQLGFTKGAQTLDHIFTIKTLVDKYKKRKQKLYCTFVDFRKAFDTVCRPALLYKLSSIGLSGNVYNVIKDMYCNSTCQLKLDGKLSESIRVKKGTEQGHTLSPELFKTFLQDLSPLLELGNCPNLQNVILSHLLWADDLVIIALDRKTLQKQMEALSNYCEKWGLLINFDKTNTIIFNDTSRTKNYLAQERISVQNHDIKVVTEYTYLGVVLNRNGSFASAVESQRKKSLRALFGMRKYLSKEDLSYKALINLFDILIKPVMSYGAPIWTPSLSITSKLIDHLYNNDVHSDITYTRLIKSFAATPSEKLHLKHLKWINSTHKYTSNIVTWGDSGRIPLVIDHIKQTLKYMNRIRFLDDNNFTKLAYLEQKELGLPWYTNCVKLRDINLDDVIEDNGSSMKTPHSVLIREKLASVFQTAWSSCLNTQPKLDTYRNLKNTFGKEAYLDLVDKSKHRSVIFKLRASSHGLEIETGRYNNTPRDKRFCTICKHGSVDAEHVEDECHFLTSCNLYSDLREGIFGPLTTKHLLKDMFNLGSDDPAITGNPTIEPKTACMKNASTIYKMYKLRTDTIKELELKPRTDKKSTKKPKGGANRT
jgi:exonuclease III